MKVLIIEDESHAAQRLQKLLDEINPLIEVIAIIESIEEAVQWFHDNPAPELVFMDIMLDDGQSFEIFEHVEIKTPVIFTTAYDEFAIRAFKVNSIDYLLKPIELHYLEQALKKYQTLSPSSENLKEMMQSLLAKQLEKQIIKPAFKDRFLIKVGEQYVSIPISEVSHFCFENKLSFLITFTNKRYMLDYTLDELEKIIDPHLFFRLNRQVITTFSSIQSIHNYFNGKLKVYLSFENSDGIVVSRERAQSLKLWLNK